MDDDFSYKEKLQKVIKFFLQFMSRRFVISLVFLSITIVLMSSFWIFTNDNLNLNYYLTPEAGIGNVNAADTVEQSSQSSDNLNCNQRPISASPARPLSPPVQRTISTSPTRPLSPPVQRTISTSPTRPLSPPVQRTISSSPTRPLSPPVQRTISTSPTRPLSPPVQRTISSSPTRPLSPPVQRPISASPARPLSDSPNLPLSCPIGFVVGSGVLIRRRLQIQH